MMKDGTQRPNNEIMNLLMTRKCMYDDNMTYITH